MISKGVRTEAAVDGANITSSECDMGDNLRLRNTISGEKVDLPRDVFDALVAAYREVEA